jgi:hypothetical protein
MRKRASKIAPEVEDLMEIFRYAYNESTDDLTRLQDHQNMYDNKIVTNMWPTNSKMPIPLNFNTVEEQIGPALEYCIPRDNFITLLPDEDDVPEESVLATQSALHRMVVGKMKLRKNSLRTFKDCFKLGIGFAIIEPFVTSPFVSSNVVIRNGSSKKKKRMMAQVNKTSLRMRYVSAGQIIVTPDGCDFHDGKVPSWSFFVDPYTEDEFRDLYLSDTDNVLKGDVEQIIDEARNMEFDSRTGIATVISNLVGPQVQNTNKEKRIPVQIPVIKCYSKHRHVWIANGTQIIFEAKNNLQTLQIPLLKCSAWPDGNRFYPMTAVEASQYLALGLNVWFNAIFDLMTYSVNPIALYNANVISDPKRGPKSDIAVGGPVENAMRYLDPPRLPAEALTLGEYLTRFYGDSSGKQQLSQNANPGMMRAGAYAFESLLQSSTGRERLASSILETNFIEPAVMQTLIYMQSGILGDVLKFRSSKIEPSSKKSIISTSEVTLDDMRYNYELILDLSDKHKNSIVEQNMKLAEFNALKDDKYVNAFQFRREFLGSDIRAERILVSPEEAARMQEEDRTLEMQERAVGISRQQGAPARPGTPAEQGMAGIAAGGF